MTDCLKKKSLFVWIEEAGRTSVLIKENLTNVLILAFSNFKKVFEFECDACGVGIGAVLSQVKKPIAFLSEKLNEARQKWFTHEHELYAVYRSLKTWESYIIASDFILFSVHHSLQHFKNQKHINKIHARWLPTLTNSLLWSVTNLEQITRFPTHWVEEYCCWSHCKAKLFGLSAWRS